MSKYIVERIKKELKENIESGQLPVDRQFALIQASIYDLLKMGEINEDAVKEHDTELDKLTQEMINIQQKISDTYKKAYDNIMKL